MRRDRVATYVTVALLLTLASLAVSGVYLTFHYAPAPSDHGAQVTHRVAAPVALVLAALLVGLARGRRRLWLSGLALTLVVATLSGNALPWSQLALWAVTADHDFAGVLRAAFDDEMVRFLLFDGVEVPQSTYRRMVLLHVVVVPPLAAGLLFAGRRVGGGEGHSHLSRRNHGGRRQHVGTGSPQG